MRVAVTLEQCWHRVPGGTAMSIIEAVRAVAALGGVEQIGVAARHSDLPDEPWRPPVAVRHLPLPRLVMYDSWHWLGWPKVERATGPVDVVHATGFAIPPRSAPLVVTIHDLAVLHDSSHFTRRGVSFLKRSIAMTKRRADLVLCPSQATLDDCADRGLPLDRLRLVPWGVHQGLASDADADRVRSTYRLPGRFVLSVATREPRKNLPRLIEAFEQLVAAGDDETALVLVGPAGWGDDLTEQIEALGSRCRVLGFVPHDDLAPIYRCASVFCYPSLLEGFGLPVVEAMAQGTPVVTSAGTSTEELVEGGAGVAVDPLSVDEIADALARLLDDPDLARATGEAGLARAAQYTWERTAELTVAAYRELA